MAPHTSTTSMTSQDSFIMHVVGSRGLLYTLYTSTEV